MPSGFTHESTHNETKEWFTPPEVFKALGLKFDLDPCHPVGERLPWIPAKKVYTKEDDGLKQPWVGLVFMNPPYGSDTPDWLSKLSAHGDGIALVFSRTDTNWFHDYCVGADVICFVRGRIRFINESREPGGVPGCGSMLLAWGERSADALLKSNLGFCLDLRRLIIPC